MVGIAENDVSSWDNCESEKDQLPKVYDLLPFRIRIPHFRISKRGETHKRYTMYTNM